MVKYVVKHFLGTAVFDSMTEAKAYAMGRANVTIYKVVNEKVFAKCKISAAV